MGTEAEPLNRIPATLVQPKAVSPSDDRQARIGQWAYQTILREGLTTGMPSTTGYR